MQLEQIDIDNDIDVNMTSLQGYLDISYAELVAKLGEPTSNGDGYKVDAEWNIEAWFDGGDCEVATVYNYKSGPNYNDGCSSVEGIRDWHIGGHSKLAVEIVEAIVYG